MKSKLIVSVLLEKQIERLETKWRDKLERETTEETNWIETNWKSIRIGIW